MNILSVDTSNKVGTRFFKSSLIKSTKVFNVALFSSSSGMKLNPLSKASTISLVVSIIASKSNLIV